MNRHRSGGTLPPDPIPMPAPGQDFAHPLPLPLLGYSRRCHPCPHSALPCASPQSFPRTPAQTLNFSRPLHRPPPANSLPHLLSLPRACQDSLSASLPVAAANISRLFPPANHPSCCRSRARNPPPLPDDAPDETNHPSRATTKNVRQEKLHRQPSTSPAFFLRRSSVAMRLGVLRAASTSRLRGAHQRLSWDLAPSALTPVPILSLTARRSRPS